MRIEIAGDNALIVYFGSETSPMVSAQVQAATQAIESSLGKALVDLIPSYASLLVIYDALQLSYVDAKKRVLDQLNQLSTTAATEGRLVELPAWYSEESGGDLVQLATNAELSTEEVIRIHTEQEYRVYAIGFAPGFAYLGEVDERIAAPRLATPRQKVPRGSVAIADRQTAVYPAVSPGGWNLIGLCPTRMFNPEADPTMPVQVGDRIRFVAIDKQEYLALGGEL